MEKQSKISKSKGGKIISRYFQYDMIAPGMLPPWSMNQECDGRIVITHKTHGCISLSSHPQGNKWHSQEEIQRNHTRLWTSGEATQWLWGPDSLLFHFTRTQKRNKKEKKILQVNTSYKGGANIRDLDFRCGTSYWKMETSDLVHLTSTKKNVMKNFIRRALNSSGRKKETRSEVKIDGTLNTGRETDWAFLLPPDNILHKNVWRKAGHKSHNLRCLYMTPNSICKYENKQEELEILHQKGKYDLIRIRETEIEQLENVKCSKWTKNRKGGRVAGSVKNIYSCTEIQENEVVYPSENIQINTV